MEVCKQFFQRNYEYNGNEYFKRNDLKKVIKICERIKKF